MIYTENCDIFASFSEEGFNNIIKHVMGQRPSLFNYATEDIKENPHRLCKEIIANPIVMEKNNPLVTVVDPIPIPGTNYGVDFAIQLREVTIDFHPGDEFDLPTELSPPLDEQRLAIKLVVCGGIGCPKEDTVNGLIPKPKDPPKDNQTHGKPLEEEDPPIITIPTGV